MNVSKPSMCCRGYLAGACVPPRNTHQDDVLRVSEPQKTSNTNNKQLKSFEITGHPSKPSDWHFLRLPEILQSHPRGCRGCLAGFFPKKRTPPPSAHFSGYQQPARSPARSPATTNAVYGTTLNGCRDGNRYENQGKCDI